MDIVHCFYAVSSRQHWRKHYVFWMPRCFVHLFVCLSSQILIPRYLMNGLNIFDKTNREYSLALTDDLITFWRSKVKAIARCWGQILWTSYLMNGLSNLDENYSSANNNWPILMTWLDFEGQRSRPQQAIYVAKVSISMLGHRSTSFSFIHIICHRLYI